jgi:hypothetical protein
LYAIANEVSMPNKTAVAVPILIIAVGIGWLLAERGFVVRLDWLWTAGLAGVGVLALVVRGIDKLSVVIGPFFLIAAVLSVLRRREILGLSEELPILVIALGVLLLVAQWPAIPPAAPGPGQRSEGGDEAPKRLRL